MNGKIQKFYRCLVCLCLAVACAGGSLTGCAENGGESSVKAAIEERKERVSGESEELARGFQEEYDKAQEEQTLDTLEFQEAFLTYLGEAGYAAVDQGNKLDMVNPEQVEAFCAQVKKEAEGETTILSVLDDGSFVRYDLRTEKGEIDVQESVLEWEEGKPLVEYYHEFQAYSWEYTKKGYLFIEEYHPPGFDGAPGQTGFRVQPLSKTCRELNLKYVLPVGYDWNNLLITDWNETDCSALDFYDLYEIFYTLKYGEWVPYTSEEGAEYEIPEQDFEEVLQTYLKVSREEIRAHTVYHEDSRTYQYRPRGMGMYDGEFPYGPYPEVTAYEYQADGTVKLRVEAVWDWVKSDQAVISELVVRPLEDGQFQYVSNKVVSWDEKTGNGWYSGRLTEEEWEDLYGGG